MLSARQLIGLLVVAVLAFLGGALIFADRDDSPDAPAESDQGLLYVQTAAAGVIDGERLELRGVADQTTAFSNRPARDAAQIGTRDFVRQFTTVFGEDPPNASLTVANRSGERVEVALGLSDPQLEDGSLSYKIDSDPSQVPEGLAGPVSLFIDSADGNIWNVSLTNSENGDPVEGIPVNVVATDQLQGPDSSDNAPSGPSVASSTTDGSGHATLLFSGTGNYTMIAFNDDPFTSAYGPGIVARDFNDNTMASDSLEIKPTAVNDPDTD